MCEAERGTNKVPQDPGSYRLLPSRAATHTWWGLHGRMGGEVFKQDPEERTPSPPWWKYRRRLGSLENIIPLLSPPQQSYEGPLPEAAASDRRGLTRGSLPGRPTPGQDVDTGGLTSAADWEGSPGRGCVTGAPELQLRTLDLRTRRNIRYTGCAAMEPVGLVESPPSNVGASGAL